MAVFTAKELTFTYPGSSVPALRDIQWTVEAGDFWVLMGGTGSGKTTLLRQMKPSLRPNGWLSGAWDSGFSDEEIGFLMQSPEDQLVTDKVWNELAFGLENRQTPPAVMTRKVGEVAGYFGMDDWLDRPCETLSGGQVQMLNLAALLTTDPKLLLLDEPTAQLDPVAANRFYQMLRQVHQDFGVTVVLCGHRLELAMPLAGHVAEIHGGRMTVWKSPRNPGKDVPRWLLPPTMEIARRVAPDQPSPLTVGEGRSWLADHIQRKELAWDERGRKDGQRVLEAKGLYFTYGGQDILKGTDVSLKRGEFTALLGGNGSGKSTLLKVLSGNGKPYRGKVKKQGKIAALPQNPKAVFGHETVEQELKEMGGDWRSAAADWGVDQWLFQHPYDLSGGQMQMLALIKLSLVEADVYLLDEPTSGLDGWFKQMAAAFFRRLTERSAVLITSHDVEFCAAYADFCGLFFDGQIVGQGESRAFFSTNRYYTTAGSRMARSFCPQAITVEDVVALCEK